MNQLLKYARSIRHAAPLRRADFLWNLLRPVWRFCMDPFGKGVSLELAGRLVRVPTELISTHPDWSNYERPNLERIGNWLDANPTATFIDIGRSYGVISSFVLQTVLEANVIAINSNLTSLKAMEAIVPPHAHTRLRRILGLLGTEHRSAQNLEAASSHTLAVLPVISAREAIMRSTYVCFDNSDAAKLPWHSLDGLMDGAKLSGPILIKCDVEGAEGLVLAGATNLIQHHRPTIILSDHPSMLPAYDQTPAGIAALLENLNYVWECFDKDHEEHWFATPVPSP